MTAPRSPGRGQLLIMLLATLMVCSAGFAQPFDNCPNPKGGDCVTETPGIPGCLNQSCCDIVCVFELTCCAVEWDDLCVEIALAQCTVCGPGNGDCFKANGTPGCDDADCCQTVCDADPSCCELEWDAFCVLAAEILCVCKPGDAPANDDCIDAISISDGLTAFTNRCATPDGPSHPGLPCGQDLSEDLGRDVWFHYTATFTGTARADTCGDADYNTELAVYDGCVCPVDPETILGCDAAGEICPGFGSQVIFEVKADNCYTIRVGGVGSADGSGLLFVGEDVPPEPPANDNCDDAISLLLGQVTMFDNSFATTDGIPSIVCSFGGQADIDNDLWYDFTPNVDGTFQVSLCGSSFDTKLAVYDGCVCPTPGNPLDCNDDVCDIQSRVTFDGVAGQCYKIRAGSSPGNPTPSGSGQIEIIQTAGCSSGNTSLTHSLDDAIFPANSVACGDNITTADNAYARSYNLAALLPGQPIDINCVTWGIELNNFVDVTAQVSIYEDVDGGPPLGPDDDLQLLASRPLLIPADTQRELMTVTFDPPIAIDPDIVLVVELALPDTTDVTGVWVGSNSNGQTDPGYIRSDFCGVPTYIDIADLPGCGPCANMHIVNSVIGTTKGDGGSVGPYDFNAFRGFYDSGDLSSLLASDDNDLCYEPGITIFPAEAPITLDFFGTLPNDSPASLDVTIESSANTVGLELTFSFWNFNTNSWDVVGTDTQSFNTDTVRTFAGTPADHVEPGTGEVRTRYEVRVVSIIFLFPWLDCIDQVFWTVN